MWDLTSSSQALLSEQLSHDGDIRDYHSSRLWKLGCRARWSERQTFALRYIAETPSDQPSASNRSIEVPRTISSLVLFTASNLSGLAPPRRTSAPASCAGALTTPVPLVAPEDWGSFWVVVRGLIIVHFGGPWEEDEKAEYFAQID